jgi:hypothetical protein
VDADHFILKIADNGRGLSEAELRNPKSLGLLGIREHAFLVGATLTSRAKVARERRSLFQSRIDPVSSRSCQRCAVAARRGTENRVPDVPDLREAVEP